LDDFNKNPPLSKDEVDILLVDLFRQLVGIKKLQTGLTDADLPYENKIGFVHFDIKSDNIMINENKRSNMIDFGSVVEYYKPLKNIKESTDITEKYDYKSIGINTNKYSPELYYLFGDTSFGENIYEHILDNERIRNKMCGNGIFEGEISDKNKNALIKLSTKKYTERLNRAKNEIKKYIVDGNINDEFHKRYFYKIMETIDVCLFGYLIKNILSNVGNVLSIESFKKLLNLADDMIHPWVGIRKDINKCVNEYRKIVDEENFIETYENSLLYRDNKLVKYIYENNNFT
jgi:serine/threonine protein kinase